MRLGRNSKRAAAGIILSGMVVAGLAVLGSSASGATDDQCVTKPLIAGAPTYKIMTLGDSITRAASGDYTWRYFLWRHLVTGGNPAAVPTSPTAYDMVGQNTTVLDPLSGALKTDVRCDFDLGTDAMPGVYGSLTAYAADETSDANPLVKVPHVQNLVKEDSANILVVFAGLEDMTSGSTPLTGAQTLALAQKVAKGAQAAKSDIKILFLTAPAAAGAPTNDKATQVASYNTSLLSPSTGAASWSTAASHVLAVSAATSWGGTDLTYDGIHPNPNGEVAIAASVAAGLKTLGVGPANAIQIPNPALPVGPRDAAVLAQPNVSGNTVNLSWTLPAGSVLSQVQRIDYTAAGGVWQNVGSPVLLASDAAGPPYTSTATDTINPAHIYQYRVVAAKSTYTTYSLLHIAQFSKTVVSNLVTVPNGATIPTSTPTVTPTDPVTTPTDPVTTPTDPITTASATPPGAVSGFTATATVHGTKLAWTPLAGAEAYRFIWFVQGNTGTIYSHDTTATSYPLTGLVPGVSYGFRVRALKSGLQGPLTAAIYKSPKAYPLTSPKPTLAAISKHRIRISWPLVDHASSYAIEIRVKGGKWRLAALTAKGSVTTTSLLKGFTYQVRLQPYDGYAAAKWSAVAQIKTK